MLKIIKKVTLSIISLLLAFLLLWCAVVWSYYPHYSKNQREILVNEAYNTDEIKIMSYNIRCHAPDDLGHKNWFYRANLVIDTIANAKPGIIGFQEVNSWQYEYLCESMLDFDSIITFRDNIPIYSEGCPVFYRTDLYTLVDKGSFWLSETPDEMSKDWGAACYRICSYVKLKDNATNNEFLVFNAHLDHISDEARINGINVVLDKIKEFGSVPAVLMGDLNAEEDSDTYRSATQSFLDVKYQTENTMTSCTYQDWGEQLDRNCIDYIMISKDNFNVNSYKVITDTYDGDYTSDHFPIIASLTFK